MGFPERKLDGNPITSGSGGALLSHTLSEAAARYSPTPSRVQYHRRAWP